MPNKKTKSTINLGVLQKTNGPTKLLFCVAVAITAYFLLGFSNAEFTTRMILAWDSFCLSMLAISWLLFFYTTSDQLHLVVEKQDDGLKAIFIIVLVAVCFSVFGTLLLLNNKGAAEANKLLSTLVSLSPIVLSWLVLHTTFAVRYAHLYHDHNKLHTGSQVGGLDFPTKDHPDYIDFSYFSFVIGMTFQVSDVQVNSRAIRRFVLMHSLISFVFNTIIVALTINSLASLGK